LIKNEILPFDDEECDIVYCISVLEHISDFEKTIREVASLLKTGGLCLLTCDIGIDPAFNDNLTIDQYYRLMNSIGLQFSLFPQKKQFIQMMY